MNYKKVRCDVCGVQRTLTGGHGMPPGWTRQVYIKCDQCQGKKVGSGLTSNPVDSTPTPDSWFPAPAPQAPDVYSAPPPAPEPPPADPPSFSSGGGGDFSGGGASGDY